MSGEGGLDGVRAVLFDAGFTLLTPIDGVGTVYRREAEALGVAIDWNAFEERRATLWSERLHASHADDALESSDELEAASWHAYTADVAAPFPALRERHEAWLTRLATWFDRPEAWRVRDGAHDVLERLRARGCRLAVVSNWHTALDAILEAQALRFDTVVTSAACGYKKPHPAIFDEALARLDRAPSEALHVGDSVRDDVEGARRVGIRPVLIGDRRADVWSIDSLTDLVP